MSTIDKVKEISWFLSHRAAHLTLPSHVLTCVKPSSQTSLAKASVIGISNDPGNFHRKKKNPAKACASTGFSSISSYC
ncbi:hypothetical protein OKW38_004129 [Paraburkholderia sp. MM5496-R1]|uniref:hypothetical protein n=1 Tax=unclassified Paraburkholderia TaxID=2615204 RepID=UPI003D25702B